MKQGKVWGNTTLIFLSNNVEVHFLEIRKEGFCSEHKHIQKTNLFYIISGQLEITQWLESEVIAGGITDTTVLQTGEFTTIPAGVFHMFRAITDVRCLEIYEVKFVGADIERRSQGGMEKG